MKSGKGTVLSIALSAATAFGQGRILWDEQINGSLSQYASDPTVLPMLRLGTNSVISGVQFQPVNGGPGGVLFSDFFKFTVNPGDSIAGIFLTYSSPIDLWIGHSDYDSELASSTDLSMGNVFPQLGIAELGRGNYAFYISAHNYGNSPFTANYRLDFVVEAIPEPASLWLLLGGLGWLGVRAWRRTRRNNVVLLLFVFSAATAFGQGTILWDEAANGPLSNDYTVATAFGRLANGTNSISGASQVIGNGIWGDYFTIVVPNSSVVSALWISADNQVDVWIGNTAYSIEYGYVLRPANGNILPQWGFDPINAGAFGLYIRDYDFSDNHTVSNYRLDFVVEAIPEPASIWLLLGGLGGFGVCTYGRRTLHPK